MRAGEVEWSTVSWGQLEMPPPAQLSEISLMWKEDNSDLPLRVLKD